MRNLLIYLFFLFVQIGFISCNRNIYGAYHYVNPESNILLNLTFNQDSTFKLNGQTSCTQFFYEGSWKKVKTELFDCYLINDTNKMVLDTVRQLYFYFKQNKIQYSIQNEEYMLEYIENDTICYTPAKKFLLKGLPFTRDNILTPNNISEERAKYIRKDFIGKYGKKLFIETFGDGKNMKRAMENLKKNNCSHR